MASAEEITKFWKDHQKELEEFYPGLKLIRLLNDFEFHPLDQRQLLSGVPLEYITGEAYFYKSEFKVTKETLIPRSETEIMVEDAVNLIKKYQYRSVLDVGTGTGAIIISIALDFKKDLKLFASDISEGALTVAKTNARNYNLPINFINSDRFSRINERFDLIISNPPYIKRESDKSTVHQSVLKYEPHSALFLPDEIYDSWFLDFIKDAYEHLNSGGTFLMEGHENHLQNLMKIYESVGFSDIRIKKDYSGRDRFIYATKEG